MSLTKIGDVLMAEGALGPALKHYEESLQICRSLAAGRLALLDAYSDDARPLTPDGPEERAAHRALAEQARQVFQDVRTAVLAGSRPDESDYCFLEETATRWRETARGGRENRGRLEPDPTSAFPGGSCPTRPGNP